jgi:hypothetical protein
METSQQETIISLVSAFEQANIQLRDQQETIESLQVSNEHLTRDAQRLRDNISERDIEIVSLKDTVAMMKARFEVMELAIAQLKRTTEASVPPLMWHGRRFQDCQLDGHESIPNYLQRRNRRYAREDEPSLVDMERASCGPFLITPSAPAATPSAPAATTSD